MIDSNPIKFKEEELFFNAKPLGKEKGEKGLFNTNDLPQANPEPEILGIKIRLGNEPIVRNLKKLLELSQGQIPPEIQILFDNNDLYTVTHAIGVIRIKGRAKVEELQYNAKIVDVYNVRTIDLLPNTTFKTVMQVNSSFEGAVKAGGTFSATIPEELKKALSNKFVSLGGDLDLQLSTNNQFVGKINCSVRLPVVTSSGVATNQCTWILNPDANPLLGDQLLIQTLAVPKGTDSLTYQLKGVVKVDKGIFYKTAEAETSTYTIQVSLK